MTHTCAPVQQTKRLRCITTSKVGTCCREHSQCDQSIRQQMSQPFGLAWATARTDPAPLRLADAALPRKEMLGLEVRDVPVTLSSADRLHIQKASVRPSRYNKTVW